MLLLAFLNHQERRPGCRATEQRQRRIVLDALTTEGDLTSGGEASKSLGRAGHFENGLGDDEAQLAGWFQIMLRRDTGHKHGKIFPSFSEDRVHASMDQQAMLAPQLLRFVPISLRQI